MTQRSARFTQPPTKLNRQAQANRESDLRQRKYRFKLNHHTTTQQTDRWVTTILLKETA